MELLGFHEKECLQCRPHRFGFFHRIKDLYFFSQCIWFWIYPQIMSYLLGYVYCTINICVANSWFSWYFLSRCEFCGQGFILAARLKHHRRNCHVRSLTYCKSIFYKPCSSQLWIFERGKKDFKSLLIVNFCSHRPTQVHLLTLVRLVDTYIFFLVLLLSIFAFVLFLSVVNGQ